MTDVESIVRLRGTLIRNQEELSVGLSPLSRLTLAVEFPSGTVPEPGTIFDQLKVVLPDQEVALTRCRVELGKAGTGARLIFLDEVYDCDALMTEGRLVNLKAFLDKLPLILTQKDDVSHEFKEYVADLTFGLSVYEKFFNEQDRIYSAEDPLVVAAAQAALIKTHAATFNRYFDAELARLDALVAPLNRDAYERCGTYFRRVMWDFILGSEFFKRTNLKPRGYAGDATMMKMIYEDRFQGRYVFNQLLHRHGVSVPAAQAVRSRRRLISGLMRSMPGNAPRRFFSVACGPAWELRDVLSTAGEAERWEGVLLDQDAEALSVAQEGLTQTGAKLGCTLKVECVNDSVRTMLRTPELTTRFGTFDFVYSMGLFDYLTPPVAQVLLRKLAALLRPGGTLLIGNYHVGNPTRHYMAFWMDWVLYLRTEEEFLGLAHGIAATRVSIGWDETRSQMFLRVDKAA